MFSNISGKTLPVVLSEIAMDIQGEGGRCFLVGGWVRDALLGCDSKDYDIEVYGLDEETLISILQKYGKPSFVGKAFGVYLMTVDKIDYEFAFPRTEVKTGKGHKAFAVYPDPYLDFETASKRRDFTINSMGVELPNMKLVDPNGGQQDLEDRVLRHVSDAFGEDPLRALRAVQFAARFQLRVLDETVQICSEQDLSELSSERFYEEFKKLLFKASTPSVGLTYLSKMKLGRFFPELELYSQKDVSQDDHYAVLDEAAESRQDESKEEEIFMFSSLCIAMSGEETERFLKRITRDVKLIKGVVACVENWREVAGAYQNKESVVEGWVRRLALKVPLKRLCRIATVVARVKDSAGAASQERWFVDFSKKVGVYNEPPKPMLMGKDLMTLGVKQGPLMGEIIKESFELQLDGVLKSHEDAVAWAQKKRI